MCCSSCLAVPRKHHHLLPVAVPNNVSGRKHCLKCNQWFHQLLKEVWVFLFCRPLFERDFYYTVSKQRVLCVWLWNSESTKCFHCVASQSETLKLKIICAASDFLTSYIIRKKLFLCSESICGVKWKIISFLLTWEPWLDFHRKSKKQEQGLSVVWEKNEHRDFLGSK